MDLDSEELVFSVRSQKGGDDYHYSRSHSNDTDALEVAIKSLYGLNGANLIDLAPSGMGAISSLFHTLALTFVVRAAEGRKGLSILLDQEVYSDTPHLLEFIRQMYAPYITLERCDCSNYETVEGTVAGSLKKSPHATVVLFTESVSNPTGRIFCFEKLQTLKKWHGDKLWVVIDNTWTTALGVNPFTYGADVVVESLTKYVSGGRAIGGVTLSPHEPFMVEVRNWHRINGLHVSAANARAAVTGTRDLKERMESSSEATLELMKALTDKGLEVIHPFVGNHPSKARNQANNLILLAPAVFVVKSKLTTKNQLRKKTLATQILEWKTSYGGPNCRINPYPEADKEKNSTFVRVSVGFEPFDLVAIVKAIESVIEK